jgi:phosphate/sulfate permease
MADSPEPDKSIPPAPSTSGKGGGFGSKGGSTSNPSPIANLPPLWPAPKDSWEWHIIETFKGLITLSVEVAKMLALVNGGAAVALLAYLGNLARFSILHPPHLTHALMWFCKGLFATVLAVIFAYLTQLKLYNEERKKRQQSSIPEDQRTPVRERHGWILAVAILLAVFAAFAFYKGCLSAASALGAVQ